MNNRIEKIISQRNWETICNLADYVAYLEDKLEENSIEFDMDWERHVDNEND